MPYAKFREVKQFGKHNTRIFKEILKARNKRKRDDFKFNPEILNMGEIHDPLDPDFFKKLHEEHRKPFYLPPKHITGPRDEDHPLYKPEKCFLFDGTMEMTDGIDQACAVIKAAKAQPFPKGFFSSLPADFLPDNFEAQVVDSIMHGERYDGTLEKLPTRFDPILFWIVGPLLYGTPVALRNQIVLSDLFRKLLLIGACKDKNRVSDLRCDRNAAISGYLPPSSSGIEKPFVFRHQPYMIIHGNRPLTPIADPAAVQVTKSMEVPDIYPISPLIDLKEEHIYNDSALLPRSARQITPDIFVNAVYSTRVQDQKYPWTREQNAANTILNGFTAALAQATRNNKENSLDILERPVTVKSLQIVNGKLDMAIVQLNTLDLNKGENDIKNMVWVEKAAHLYTPKPFYENMNEVTDLNSETLKKFVNFVLYR